MDESLFIPKKSMRRTLPIFFIVSFLSAFLLFIIQPVISKILTPVLGGAPSVWNSLLFLFQFLLLVGYVGAHMLIKWAKGRRSGFLVYIGLIGSAFFLLPWAIEIGSLSPDYNNPVIWTLLSALQFIGFPFLVLALTAPIMQVWVQRMHSDYNPYRLYSISNLGSLIAIISYPFLIEPFAPVSSQLFIWSGLFVLLGILSILISVLTFGTKNQNKQRVEKAAPINHQTIFLWFALAFIPSSLLHGVTTFITADIASIPLLWMLPLVLYLLSFIIAFAKNNPISPILYQVPLAVLSILIVLLPFFIEVNNSLVLIATHLLIFFIAACGCHFKLAEKAPGTSSLTLFYLWISIGGISGGFLNAIAAPILFNTIFEYALTLTLMVFLLFWSQRFKAREVIKPAILSIVFLIGFSFITPGNFSETYGIKSAFSDDHKETIYQQRNFFGVIRVVEDSKNGIRTYYNGSTPHTSQSDHYKTSLPQFFDYIFKESISKNSSIAVLGMGPGALLCHSHSSQHFSFYEINPAVVTMAQNPENFTYLRDCGVPYDITIGDARLKISHAENQKYDAVIFTAINAGSLPFHLLTEEAFQIYFDKLKDNGVFIMFAPKRYFDFTNLLKQHAAYLGMNFAQYNYDNDRGGWVIMTKNNQIIQSLSKRYQWEMINPTDNSLKTPLWTDNFYNIFKVLNIF